MKNIYKLTRTGFDSLENHNPRYTNVIGFFSTQKSAQRMLTKLEKSEKKYRGYDDETYPQFKIKSYKVQK